MPRPKVAGEDRRACGHREDRPVESELKRVANFNDYSQAQFDLVAAGLNGRPRKTLEYMTASQKLNKAVALTRLARSRSQKGVCRLGLRRVLALEWDCHRKLSSDEDAGTRR
jgi:hypothetical protein